MSAVSPRRVAWTLRWYGQRHFTAEWGADRTCVVVRRNGDRCAEASLEGAWGYRTALRWGGWLVSVTDDRVYVTGRN